MSRFHCAITREAGGFRVLDTGSLNGTRLRGVRVRDAMLELPESRLEVGDSVLVLREVGTVHSAELPARPSLGPLYGVSVPMLQLFELVRRVAKSDASVLIEGESGTGKELVATELVQRSARADKPLVIVDCGAIAPSLVETELFGHARGAFTGAVRDRAGAFELADGGTLFLDEIGELPLDVQPKLLRALTGEVQRVGEAAPRKVDVRVVAATNRRLEREVNLGRFREDLYYRLAVVSLRVPPLRERPGDLGVLVNAFLLDLDAADRGDLFDAALLERMASYDWPGNVRELRNFVERMVVLGEVDGGSLGATSTPPPPSPPPAADAPPDLGVPFRQAKDAAVASFERCYLEALLAATEGNVSKAARQAGLERMYLHRLLQRHGLRRGGALGK